MRYSTKQNTNKKGEIKTIATNYICACHGGIERVNAQLMTLWIQMGYDAKNDAYSICTICSWTFFTFWGI